MTASNIPSPSKPPGQLLSPAQVARSWRTATLAGMFGVMYAVCCIQEVPRVRFLTELKATPLDFGVIAGLSAFAICFQLIAGIWASRIRRRKSFWITVTLIHRLVFIGVLAAPALFLDERARVWWIIGVLFLHDSLANLGGPLWMAWMGDIVPSESVNRMWAGRQRTLTAVNVIGAVFAGLVIGYFEKRTQVILGFTLLAVAGVASGVAETLMFLSIPDPAKEAEPERDLWEATLRPLRDKQFRPFLYFSVYWYFALMLAAPFFTPYMVQSLKMPALTAQLVVTAALIGVVLGSPFWGILCDTYGNRPVLQITLVAKAFSILAFIFAPPIPAIYIPCLAASYFLDGLVSAGVMIAIQGITFHASPRRGRAMYIGMTNFLAVGVAGGISPVIAGRVIELLRDVSWEVGIYRFNGYHLIFTISVALRLGALYFAARVPSRKMIPMRVVAAQMANLREMIPAMWELRQLSSARLAGERARAARRLRDRRSPLAIGGLIDALEDPSRTVRQAAADALGKIGTSEASAPLARALVSPESGVRHAAARALGRIGDFASLQALLQNLRNLDSETLGQSVDALARIGDSAAILPLISLFDEIEDPGLRQKISEALCAINKAGTPQEIMALFGRDRRPHVAGVRV